MSKAECCTSIKELAINFAINLVYGNRRKQTVAAGRAFQSSSNRSDTHGRFGNFCV